MDENILGTLGQLRQQTIEKWEQSGLLNGIVGGYQRNNLFDESENVNDLLLPIVRRALSSTPRTTIPTPDEIKNYINKNNLKSPDNQTVTK